MVEDGPGPLEPAFSNEPELGLRVRHSQQHTYAIASTSMVESSEKKLESITDDNVTAQVGTTQVLSEMTAADTPPHKSRPPIMLEIPGSGEERARDAQLLQYSEAKGCYSLSPLGVELREMESAVTRVLHRQHVISMAQAAVAHPLGIYPQGGGLASWEPRAGAAAAAHLVAAAREVHTRARASQRLQLALEAWEQVEAVNRLVAQATGAPMPGTNNTNKVINSDDTNTGKAAAPPAPRPAGSKLHGPTVGAVYRLVVNRLQLHLARWVAISGAPLLFQVPGGEPGAPPDPSWDAWKEAALALANVHNDAGAALASHLQDLMSGSHWDSWEEEEELAARAEWVAAAMAVDRHGRAYADALGRISDGCPETAELASPRRAPPPSSAARDAFSRPQSLDGSTLSPPSSAAGGARPPLAWATEASAARKRASDSVLALLRGYAETRARRVVAAMEGGGTPGRAGTTEELGEVDRRQQVRHEGGGGADVGAREQKRGVGYGYGMSPMGPLAGKEAAPAQRDVEALCWACRDEHYALTLHFQEAGGSAFANRLGTNHGGGSNLGSGVGNGLRHSLPVPQSNAQRAKERGAGVGDDVAEGWRNYTYSMFLGFARREMAKGLGRLWGCTITPLSGGVSRSVSSKARLGQAPPRIRVTIPLGGAPVSIQSTPCVPLLGLEAAWAELHQRMVCGLRERKQGWTAEAEAGAVPVSPGFAAARDALHLLTRAVSDEAAVGARSLPRAATLCAALGTCTAGVLVNWTLHQPHLYPASRTMQRLCMLHSESFQMVEWIQELHAALRDATPSSRTLIRRDAKIASRPGSAHLHEAGLELDASAARPPFLQQTTEQLDRLVAEVRVFIGHLTESLADNMAEVTTNEWKRRGDALWRMRDRPSGPSPQASNVVHNLIASLHLALRHADRRSRRCLLQVAGTAAVNTLLEQLVSAGRKKVTTHAAQQLEIDVALLANEIAGSDSTKGGDSSQLSVHGNPEDVEYLRTATAQVFRRARAICSLLLDKRSPSDKGGAWDHIPDRETWKKMQKR